MIEVDLFLGAAISNAVYKYQVCFRMRKKKHYARYSIMFSTIKLMTDFQLACKGSFAEAGKMIVGIKFSRFLTLDMA